MISDSSSQKKPFIQLLGERLFGKLIFDLIEISIAAIKMITRFENV